MFTDLQEKIMQLKREKGISILAHSYQDPDILEIADLTGDSFKLSKDAVELPNETVLVCGVGFMADTVKILSPEKRVLLAAADATCPMADMIAPERVEQYKKENPSHAVVAYVNTTTELKAVSDVCVTSSSAVKIIARLREDHILFIPDKNLGGYVRQQFPEKTIITWDGYCPVHNQITAQQVKRMKESYPGYKLLMHPEIPTDALEYADLVGSTADILNYAHNSGDNLLIGTENAVAHYLALQYPTRRFVSLSKYLSCPDMRMTTLADVYHALLGQGGREIDIPETLRLRAKRAIDRMIELGQ